MTDGHISCAPTEGVVRPVLHELLPLGEEVTTPIRSLHLVAHRMGQCHFRDLIRVVGLLCAPVTERRAEPMGHSLQLQATQHRLVERQAQLRKDGRLPFLRPDAKSQVTMRYVTASPTASTPWCSPPSTTPTRARPPRI